MTAMWGKENMLSLQHCKMILVLRSEKRKEKEEEGDSGSFQICSIRL